jgi:Trp operon repressor
LQDWTDSAGVFIRFAPETKIVPVLVSGVLWEQAVKSPLTRLKKTRNEREKLGAALQLLAHILFNAQPLRIIIQFGRPITLAELGSKELTVIHNQIMENMRSLLQNPPNSHHD